MKIARGHFCCLQSRVLNCFLLKESKQSHWRGETIRSWKAEGADPLPCCVVTAHPRSTCPLKLLTWSDLPCGQPWKPCSFCSCCPKGLCQKGFVESNKAQPQALPLPSASLHPCPSFSVSREWVSWVNTGWSSPDSLQPRELYNPWNSQGQNNGVDSCSLLQEIFPTQGSNPSLPHCRWILYQLSHKGSPRILEWVAYPFSNRSFQPRNRAGVSCIAGRLFTNWAIRDARTRQKVDGTSKGWNPAHTLFAKPYTPPLSSMHWEEGRLFQMCTKVLSWLNWPLVREADSYGRGPSEAPEGQSCP